MKVKSEREVAQLCLTPIDPMDCSPPGSSVHGIFQARVLEWGAIAISGGGWTSIQKPTPHMTSRELRAFIGRGRGLDAETAQSAQ